MLCSWFDWHSLHHSFAAALHADLPLLLASTLWQIKWLCLAIPCIGLSVIHTKDNNYNDNNDHVQTKFFQLMNDKTLTANQKPSCIAWAFKAADGKTVVHAYNEQNIILSWYRHQYLSFSVSKGF